MQPVRVIDVTQETSVLPRETGSNDDEQIVNEPTLLSKRQKKRMHAVRAALRKKEVAQQVAASQVAMPNVLIDNTFEPLRWVRKNSSTAQLRNSWELPTPDVQQAPESVPTQKVSWAQRIREAYQATKGKRQGVGSKSLENQGGSIQQRISYLSGDKRAPKSFTAETVPRPTVKRQTMKRKVEWQVKKSPEVESAFDRLGPKTNNATGSTKKTLTVTLNGDFKKRKVAEQYASCNMVFGIPDNFEDEQEYCYMIGDEGYEIIGDPPEDKQPCKGAAVRKFIYEGETSNKDNQEATSQEANNQEMSGNNDMAFREAMKMSLEYRQKYEQRELEVHELRKQNEVMMAMINDLQRQMALQNKEKAPQGSLMYQTEPENELSKEPLIISQNIGKQKVALQPQTSTRVIDRKNVAFIRPEEEEVEYVPRNVPRQSRVMTDPTPAESQEMTEKRVQELINQQLKKTGIKTFKKVYRSQGRLYPAFYDQVPYPAGYSMPTFMKFSGEGITNNNPSQHIAHFRAACGNTGSDSVFLLRQFSQSLTGAAFDWYCSLEDGSINNWDEMVEAFLEKFVVITERVTIADLATLKPNKDESISNFIGRWKNMYIKCDTQIEEEDAIAMILKNVDNWMVPFLSVANISTLQQLMQYVKRLQARPPPGAATGSGFSRFQRGGRADTNFVNTINKEQGNKQITTKAVSKQPVPTLEERMNKTYSFRRDKVAKIFKDALKDNLPLPECKRPKDADRCDEPNFCPYHRVLGHTIEDCYVFKDIIEGKYKRGEITLPESVLQNPAPHAQVNMICHEVPAPHALGSSEESGGPWSVHVSKRTCKMIKALQNMPEVAWMDESTPVLTEKKVQPQSHRRQKTQEKQENKKASGRASCRPTARQVIKDDDTESDGGLDELFKEPAFCFTINNKGEKYGESSRSREIDVTDDRVMKEVFDKVGSLERKLLLRDMEIEELRKTLQKERNEERTGDGTNQISFTDKDLLQGTANHNKPLYVTGLIEGCDLDHILVDPGSSVNIIPAGLLRRLNLEKNVLTYKRGGIRKIRGFNHTRQKVTGMIELKFQVEELVAETIRGFHALLGKPWLHDNQVVPSTLHQCMKYVKYGKEIRIDGDLEIQEMNFDDKQELPTKRRRKNATIMGQQHQIFHPMATTSDCTDLCISSLPDDCIIKITSLTTPSDVCKVSVVSKRFLEFAKSDEVWQSFLPDDYTSILSRASEHVGFSDMKSLFCTLAHRPTLLDKGTMSFWLDRFSGIKSYVLSASLLTTVYPGELTSCWKLVPFRSSRFGGSRFGEVIEADLQCDHLIISGEINAKELSPGVWYSAYLIYKLPGNAGVIRRIVHRTSVIVGSQACRNMVYIEPRFGRLMQEKFKKERTFVQEGPIARERRDGWIELELGNFFNYGVQDKKVSIRLSQRYECPWKGGIIVEGIEIRQKECRPPLANL